MFLHDMRETHRWVEQHGGLQACLDSLEPRGDDLDGLHWRHLLALYEEEALGGAGVVAGNIGDVAAKLVEKRQGFLRYTLAVMGSVAGAYGAGWTLLAAAWHGRSDLDPLLLGDCMRRMAYGAARTGRLTHCRFFATRAGEFLEEHAGSDHARACGTLVLGFLEWLEGRRMAALELYSDALTRLNPEVGLMVCFQAVQSLAVVVAELEDANDELVSGVAAEVERARAVSPYAAESPVMVFLGWAAARLKARLGYPAGAAEDLVDVAGRLKVVRPEEWLAVELDMVDLYLDAGRYGAARDVVANLQWLPETLMDTQDFLRKLLRELAHGELSAARHQVREGRGLLGPRGIMI